MSEIQHTPGPWEAERNNDREQYFIGHRRVDFGQRCVAIVNFGYDEPAESEQHANARLIAAAPELLALAKQNANECADCDGEGDVINPDGEAGETQPCEACAHIRAVIAKAEGQL